MSDAPEMRREWLTDNVRFTLTDAGMTIRDRAGETASQWLASFVLFAVVLAVGCSFLAPLGRDVATRGLVEDGPPGFASYADAIGKLLLILGVIFGVMMAWARPVFGGHQILELDEKTATLTNVDFGVRWRRRVFPGGEISEVEYTIVSSSEHTNFYGIRFFAGKRRVVMFRNIKPDAAAEVIQAMRSYGAA